jgi:hypothetical protein
MIKHGHYISFLIHFTAYIVPVVGPLKSGLLQVSKDRSGYAVDVSGGIAAILILVYTMIIISVVGMFRVLFKRPTGLKWEAASLASQIALLNHLNNRQAFTGTEFAASTASQIREKEKSYGMLRLGYWEHDRDGSIIHGIRFIQGERISIGFQA